MESSPPETLFVASLTLRIVGQTRRTPQAGNHTASPSKRADAGVCSASIDTRAIDATAPRTGARHALQLPTTDSAYPTPINRIFLIANILL